MKRIVMMVCAGAIGAAALCGCSSSQLANTSASGLLAPALGLGGGLAGLYATEDEDIGTQLAATGAAAAGAFLLGQFIENDFKEEKAKEYRAGYDLGRANSIKELYWLTQLLHRAQDGDQPQMQMYELPVQYPANGAKYVPDTVYLPVVK